MASNCAVIASQLPPIREFCQDSIVWAAPEDKDSLINGISCYLDNINLYNEHRKFNNQLIQNDYNWENISNKLLNLYKELLD